MSKHHSSRGRGRRQQKQKDNKWHERGEQLPSGQQGVQLEEREQLQVELQRERRRLQRRERRSEWRERQRMERQQEQRDQWEERRCERLLCGQREKQRRKQQREQRQRERQGQQEPKAKPQPARGREPGRNTCQEPGSRQAPEPHPESQPQPEPQVGRTAEAKPDSASPPTLPARDKQLDGLQGSRLEQRQVAPLTKGRVYGYVRVSTREQNLDRQLAALAEFGVEPEMVFADKASGADFERPAWQALMRELEAEDVLVVKSIDRLGRDYDEIIDEWRRITKQMGAHIVVLDMPLLDTRDKAGGVTGAFLADVVLQLLSYVAQVERDNLLQRQAEGILAAQARGVQFGRPPMEQPEGYREALEACRRGEASLRQAARDIGVSPRTFRRWMDDYLSPTGGGR